MKHAMIDPALRTHVEDDTLSAFIDGEIQDDTAHALLKRLSQDTPERDRFREYSLIGDMMRGLDHDVPDLTSRVMAALEGEPTVLAPMRKTSNRHPALWLAAATVVAITWGLWNADPREETLAPLAANQNATLASANSESGNAMPYLAAHQDFAQAVVSPSEMHFTRVTLVGAGQ
jgi:sigma-E factor negative regulatory protein RseA